MRKAIALLALGVACGGGGGSDWLTYPGYSGHAKYFPLVGSVHASLTCDQCHESGSSFTQFDCVTCHSQQAAAASTTLDAMHAAVAGFQAVPVPPPSPDFADSAQCYGCHPNGTGIMADHGKYFPIGSGTSHNLGCTQCHGDPAYRSDLSAQQCNTCHLAVDAALASGHSSTAIGGDFSTASPLACLRCHADGQVDAIASHGAFSIPHQGATCLVCHDQLRTDKVASPVPPATAPQQYAADFTSDPSACANLAARQGCYHCHSTCPPTGN